jgi:hypothetical protein
MRRAMVEWCAIFLGATASVIPYGAQSRTIIKELCGKVPGTLNKRTGLWVGTTGAMAGRFMTPAEAEQADKDGASVGVFGEHFPFTDIDIEDGPLASEILALALKILGPAPVRRREGTTRCGVMYVGVNIRKRQIEWGGDKEKGIKANIVEVLGRGQYWNADGLHPSGLPYYWDHPHPCDLGPFNLTEITQEMVDAFIAAVRELLERRGIVVKVSGTGKREGLSSGTRTGLDNPSLHAPSPEAVLDLLASYRPQGHMPHDQFVQHMVAIKASLGPDREDYYADVLAWAPDIRSTEDEATRKRWDSIHDASIGWGWLCQKAGYVGADYADEPPQDAMPTDPGELMMREFRKRWVYIAPQDCFHDTLKIIELSKDAFNAVNADFVPYGVPPRGSTAVACLNDRKFKKVDGSIYEPGGELFVTDEDRTLVNRWRPSPLKRKEGDARPWLDLMEKLFPDPAVLNHVLDYMAYVAQNPGKKIGHAMIWYSQMQGVGKDTALEPLLRLVGMKNVVKIDPDDLTKPHNDYLGKQVIVCNEMMNFERAATYNRFKSYLEMSSKLLVVNPKYGRKYEVKNNHIWIFCTNHPNAISLEVHDRRLFVCECPSILFSGKDADDLYAWYEKDGYSIVFEFLWSRDISKFNPAHPPPMTAAKEAMINMAKSSFDRWADREFDRRECITVPEIREAGLYGPSAPHDVHVQMANSEDYRIIKWLKINGFEAVQRIKIEGSDPITVWVKNPTNEIRNTPDRLLAARLAADRKKKL